MSSYSVKRSAEQWLRMRPRVSVVVPVYNVETELPRCIDSILRQSYDRLEVLLVDDGSTDGSGRICDDAATKDARVRVIHIENSGVSRARNVGLDNASGDYVQFVDSDDYLEPSLLQTLVEVAMDGGPDLIIAGYVSENAANGKRSVSNLHTKLRNADNAAVLLVYSDLYLAGGIHHVWNILYSAAFLRAHDFRFDTTLDFGEDLTFNVTVLRAASSVSVYPGAAGYIYRQARRADRLSSRVGADSYERRRAVQDRVLLPLVAEPRFHAQAIDLERAYVRMHCSTMPWSIARTLGPLAYAEFRSNLSTLRADKSFINQREWIIQSQRNGDDWQYLDRLLAGLFLQEADFALFALLKSLNLGRRAVDRLLGGNA